MIPRNNPEKFVEKYGDLWYLREFDYLPEQLKYYSHNIRANFMKNVQKEDRLFDIFHTREEAQKASDDIRRVRELQII